MHVLHIPISLPRQNSPTSGIYIKRLAEAQRNAEQFDRVDLIGVEVCSLPKNLYRILRRKKPNWLLHDEADYIFLNSVHTLKKYSKRHGGGAIKYAHEVLKLFEEYVEKRGIPDIIHTHSGRGAGLAAAFIKIAHGIPYVVTEHNPSFINDELDRDIDQLRFVYNEAEQIFVVSKGMKEGIQTVGEYPTTVFPHVLAEPFTREIPRNPPERPYFLSVGRLNENRNQQLAIDALHLCREEYNLDCALRLAGTGKKEEELRSHVSDLGLNSAVKFLGHIPQKKLKDEYTNAEATLICSNYETFSPPVIESLGCETPVISTPVTGPKSITETVGDGVYIREHTSESFARQMAELLMSEEIDRARIRTIALDNYSPQSIASFSFEQYEPYLTSAE